MSVAEAQKDLDNAIRIASEAQHAAHEKQRDVGRARERLEAAKRVAAATVPVDRSQRECIGGMDPYHAYPVLTCDH